MEQQKINETQQQPLGREFCVVVVADAAAAAPCNLFILLHYTGRCVSR
jgi:hypothetical protein